MKRKVPIPNLEPGASPLSGYKIPADKRIQPGQVLNPGGFSGRKLYTEAGNRFAAEAFERSIRPLIDKSDPRYEEADWQKKRESLTGAEVATMGILLKARAGDATAYNALAERHEGRVPSRTTVAFDTNPEMAAVRDRLAGRSIEELEALIGRLEIEAGLKPKE